MRGLAHRSITLCASLTQVRGRVARFAMDIEKLKEKLDAAQFDALKGHIDSLTSQRDEARRESVDGRKGLKEKLAAAESARDCLLERLGIVSMDELGDLPDMKGQAEAMKQVEAKMKRLEKQLSETAAARDEAISKQRTSLQKAIMAEAIGAHDFIHRGAMEAMVERSLFWEGDELYMKTDDGKLVSVNDGVAGLAKSAPELLKSAGARGSGFNPSAGGAGSKTMTRAEFEAMSPAAKVEAAKTGVQLT